MSGVKRGVETMPLKSVAAQTNVIAAIPAKPATRPMRYDFGQDSSTISGHGEQRRGSHSQNRTESPRKLNHGKHWDDFPEEIAERQHHGETRQRGNEPEDPSGAQSRSFASQQEAADGGRQSRSANPGSLP